MCAPVNGGHILAQKKKRTAMLSDHVIRGCHNVFIFNPTLTTIVLVAIIASVCTADVITQPCEQTVDPGPCTKNQQKYYYNIREERCDTFIYGGCYGNDNIFDTEEACIKACQDGNIRKHESESGQDNHHEEVDRQIFRNEELTLAQGKGERSFTLAEPESFIQVDATEIPAFQLRDAREISFQFRTRLPHGLLLYHSIKNKPHSLPNYELYVMLDQGQVKVLHLFGDYSTVLVVGKALNRDNWHTVQVRVDPSDAKLSVTVDNDSDIQNIEGLVEKPNYGVTEDVDSIVFIGGLNTRETQIDISFFANPFVGCLRGIVFRMSSEAINPLISSKHRNITEGCQNRCHTLENLCVHNSICVNHYNKVTCDCFGTGYEGKYCDYDYPSSLTTRGSSYVAYTVYDWMDRVHSASTVISLQFRTTFDDAVLFYAVGELPTHNHIAASLINGSVYINVDFGGGEASAQLGEGLHTGAWTKLTILHEGKHLQFILNGENHTAAIPGDEHHLYVDPEVYIGGVPKSYGRRQRPGLASLQNFVGCMKEVYFNDFSIVYQLKEGNPKVKYHGLLTPELGDCHEVETIPVTFPFAESGLWFEGPKLEGGVFNLEFEFSTALGIASLAYGTVKTAEGDGYFEIRRLDQELIFLLVPDATRNASHFRTVKTKLDPQVAWHYVKVNYANSEVKLMSDFQTPKVEPFAKTLDFATKLMVGGSVISPHLGLIGCLRDVLVQGVMQDPRSVVGTDRQLGDVSLDNCQFVDPCQRPNACEHGGRCTQSGGKVICDCSDSGYLGKNCHFAVYKRTCEELGLLGYSQPGVYKIDIDGNGPYPPAHVRCEFETMDGVTKTVVEHNLASQTDVRGIQFDDFSLHISYREFTPEMLQSLIGQSVQCHQHLKYECFKAPLGLHSFTWFKSSANSGVIDSIGDARRGRCMCAENRSCGRSNQLCNCDYGSNSGVLSGTTTGTVSYPGSSGSGISADEEKWLFDEGVYTSPDRLGITDMYFMQQKTMAHDAVGRITLEPLECVEANTQRFVVTFKTLGSYLEVPAWKSGELAFSFRTTGTRAILLYQPPLHPQQSSFLVMLTSSNDLTFHFTINGAPMQLVVKSPRRLNTGEWQQVWIDYDEYHVRFTLNREFRMIDLEDVQTFGPFEGTLYVAGAPEEYLAGLEVSEGLIGCFRGLVINGQVLDLYSYMKFHRADIVKDCRPSCDPNPCLNGASCIEHWGSFECGCANPWAHSGRLCEKNLNVDGLTFLTHRASLRKAYDQHASNEEAQLLRSMLTSNLYINLRTYEENALILYVNDNFNNFIQLHIQDGRRVAFTFNVGPEIKDVIVDYSGLNHGTSIQIAIERHPEKTILHVNDKWKAVEASLTLLTTYNTKPWLNPGKEYFFPPRPFSAPSQYHQAYLGGYDGDGLEAKVNTSKTQGYVGCLRGLKVGDKPIQLQSTVEMSLKRDMVGIMEGCSMVCDSGPCKNGGLCIEDFKNKIYSCDCEFASYSGQHCSDERGASFDGDALIQRRYSMQGPVTEAKFQIAFSCTERKNVDTAILVAQTANIRTYYFLISLTYDGHLRVQEDRENFVFGAIITNKNFFDGARHSVYYKRILDNSVLMVDQEEVPISIVGTSIEAERLTYISQFNDELQIGGIRTDDFRFQEYGNFKGCLSNVYVKLNGIEMRPLEEYMGYIKNHADEVHVVNPSGIRIDKCSAFDLGSGVFLPPENESQVIGPEWYVEPPSRQLYTVAYIQASVSNSETEKTVFTILVIIFLVVVVGVFGYMWRVHKRHKKRVDEEDDDDQFYRQSKNHSGRFLPGSNSTTNPVKYVSFQQTDPDTKSREANELVPLTKNEFHQNISREENTPPPQPVPVEEELIIPEKKMSNIELPNWMQTPPQDLLTGPEGDETLRNSTSSPPPVSTSSDGDSDMETPSEGDPLDTSQLSLSELYSKNVTFDGYGSLEFMSVPYE